MKPIDENPTAGELLAEWEFAKEMVEAFDHVAEHGPDRREFHNPNSGKITGSEEKESWYRSRVSVIAAALDNLCEKAQLEIGTDGCFWRPVADSEDCLVSTKTPAQEEQYLQEWLLIRPK